MEYSSAPPFLRRRVHQALADVTDPVIDPDRLPDAVVAYVDSTIALPILTAYALGKRAPRPLRRLYTKRDALMCASDNEGCAPGKSVV